MLPLSPEAPSTVTPCNRAFWKPSAGAKIAPLFGNVSSVAPKLWEITSPRLWLMT